MKTKEVMRIVLDVLSTFNSRSTTPDVHLDHYMATHKGMEGDEMSFIKEMFLGQQRWKSLHHTTTTLYYSRHPTLHPKREGPLLSTLTHLCVLLVWEEISPVTFRRLIHTQEALHTHLFLKFFFGQEQRDALREVWQTVYDHEFVKEKLLDRLDNAAEKIWDLLNDGKTEGGGGRDTGNTEGPKSRHDVNVNVDADVAVDVDVNEATSESASSDSCPPVFKATPIPSTTYQQHPGILRRLEREREQHRVEALARKRERGFRLRTEERPSNKEKIREEVDQAIEAELMKRPVVNPPPSRPHGEPVRPTAATILREDVIYRKRQDEEVQILRAFEETLRDASEHHRWQEEMKARDEQVRQKFIEQRRREAATGARRAAQAKDNKIRENREVVHDMRTEEKDTLRQRQENQEKEKQKARELAEKIIEARKNAWEAQRGVEEQKRKQAEDLAVTKRELWERARKEAEIERVKKQDLIMQIRALERVPAPKVKVYDPSETPDTGTIDAMSLVELRARLNALKMEETFTREDKRQSILARKRAREGDLTHRHERLIEFRKMASAEAERRRAQRKLEEEDYQRRAQEKKDKGMRELARRLSKKAADREAELERLNMEKKEIMHRNALLKTAKDHIEERRQQELAKGQERTLRVQQQRETRRREREELARRRDHENVIKKMDQEDAARVDYLIQYEKKFLDQAARIKEQMESERRKRRGMTSSHS